MSKVLSDGATISDPHSRGRLRLDRVEVLVVGDRVWGRAATLDGALAKAGRPRRYIAYLCHPGTRVCGDGSLEFRAGYRPHEFHRHPRTGWAPTEEEK